MRCEVMPRRSRRSMVATATCAANEPQPLLPLRFPPAKSMPQVDLDGGPTNHFAAPLNRFSRYHKHMVRTHRGPSSCPAVQMPVHGRRLEFWLTLFHQGPRARCDAAANTSRRFQGYLSSMIARDALPTGCDLENCASPSSRRVPAPERLQKSEIAVPLRCFPSAVPSRRPAVVPASAVQRLATLAQRPPAPRASSGLRTETVNVLFPTITRLDFADHHCCSYRGPRVWSTQKREISHIVDSFGAHGLADRSSTASSFSPHWL